MKTKSKIVLRSLLLLVLFAALIIVPMRWQAWFGMPAEPVFTLSPGIQRVLVTAGADGIRDRIVTWVSGDSLPISFAVDGDTAIILPRKVTTEGGVTFAYRSPALHLAEGVHRYSILSGTEAFEDSLSIKEGKDFETFVYIGDIQDREPGLTRDFLRSIEERQPQADAWLFAGDMLERGHDRYWEIFYEAVRDFAPHTPFLPAAGNHEYTKGLNKHADPRWIEAFPRETLPFGVFSYCTDYPHARLVTIDTNHLPYGFLTLIEWLKKVLTERTDHPFLIVMMHHGVHSMASGRVNLTERLILGPLFRKCGVHLVLQGHDHVYARMKAKPGEPHYLTSTTSLKSYGVKPDPSRLEASADSGRFYVVLDIDGETLRGTTFDEKHTPFDQFTIENNLRR